MAHDLGTTVNNLGCSASDLADDVLITDAVVLCKCVHPNGSVSLFMAHSDGMSWIERLGMLRAAERIENQDYQDFTE